MTENTQQLAPQSASDVAFSGFLRSKPAPRNFPVVGEISIPKFNRELPRMLWIGDAMVPTGFATVTHSLVERLWRNWDVLVSGINCSEPNGGLPYPIVPAQLGEDMWGIDRFTELCAGFKPDLVVINNDWWNVARFLEYDVGVPIAAYMPVDGANLDPDEMKILNRLEAAVWYTEFGWNEARSAGYQGARHVVPHGTDLPVASSVGKSEARKRLGLDLPDGAFLVGNVNRNQPRKRIDLTLQYFASWVQERNIDDAWLCLHCSYSDDSWDLQRLAEYHGIADRIVYTNGDGTIGSVSAEDLDLIYRSFDLQVTTTSGEGWGLTTMEGMARGIPQIAPDWAALGEWAEGAVDLVPCSNTCAHPMINTIGAIPDREPFVAAMDKLYRSREYREASSAAAFDRVAREQFRWEAVAESFGKVLKGCIAPAASTVPLPLRRAS